MFKNYILVALRNLINHKLYSAINIVGLAVGLAACVLIALFVQDEFSYDKHWAKADSLYRLHTTFNLPGREPMVTVQASGLAKEALRAYFPEEVGTVTRFNNMYPVVRYEDRTESEGIVWTDPETADLFDFKVIAGDIHRALNDNASLAINQSFATRYFGDAEPIGKIMTINNYNITRDYRVAAVFEDLPHSTVLNFQALAKIDEADFTDQTWEFNQWYSVNNYLFFELKAGASIKTLEARLGGFIDASIDFEPNGKFNKPSDFMDVSVQKMTNIQLNPKGGAEMKTTGSMTNVIIFISIAALILLIACINFMNLATAKSTQRAREVALRKVLGANRGQLIAQFLGESILLAVVGLVLGVVLVELLVGPFGDFVGKSLTLSYADPVTVGLLVGLVLMIGTVGGVYPALVLSGFLPAHVLKANKSAETSGSASFRNILVIVQFAISIGLIVATSTVYGQKLYVTSVDPGFNKENLMVIWNLDRTDMEGKHNAFRQEVLRLPGVRSAALSADTPSNGNDSNSSVRREEDDPSESLLFGRQQVGFEFFDTYEIDVLAGRLYERDRETDGTPRPSDVPEGQQLKGTLVINQAAAFQLGYASAEDATGKRVSLGVGRDRQASMEIIGVIPDMKFQSLRRPMRPEIYTLNRTFVRALTVKYEGNGANLAKKIEDVWRNMAPTVPFRHEYLDERMAEEFGPEEQQALLLAVFAGLAIVIACLGLYGLASFTAERRTKEIGIRKIMGASVFDIVRLLIWQFSKPVLIANLIAWPLVVYGLISWLETFPYRLESWWLAIFCVVSGLLALTIAWATVGGNAAKVARSNPIKALRYE